MKIEQPPVAAAAPRPVRPRAEKAEKQEKGEKEEKGEKHEKREVSWLGPLIGGVVLIFLGLMSYISITVGPDIQGMMGAIFLVVIGVLIIFGALYAYSMASRRHPRA